MCFDLGHDLATSEVSLFVVPVTQKANKWYKAPLAKGLTVDTAASRTPFGDHPLNLEQYTTWLRTNGVNTNGAAAEVMNFDRLGKKVRPGTFGNIQVG